MFKFYFTSNHKVKMVLSNKLEDFSVVSENINTSPTEGTWISWGFGALCNQNITNSSPPFWKIQL